MDDHEGNHIAAMEKLLQQAFNLHKESSRGMSSNLVKTKTQYYKTLERCQELQKQNEDLIVQNKQLKQLLENQQNSCPHCSKVITVDSSSSASVDSRSNTSPHIKPSSTSNSCKRSSTSTHGETSNSAKRSSTSPHGKPLSTSTQKTSPGISSEDDVLDFGEDFDRTTEGKRKLHRRHNKKRKYFEDVSPELKRSRKTSPKISPDNKPVERESKSLTSSQNFQPKQDNNVKSRKSVLVPDTCDDDSSKTQHSKKDKTRHSKSDLIRHLHTGVNGTGDATSVDADDDDDHELDLGVIDNLSVLVVPETMAMDDIGIELYPDVGLNRRRFGADLSDIAEDQETLNSQLEHDNTLVDSNSDSIVKQQTGVLSKSGSNLKQQTVKQQNGLHSNSDNKHVKQRTAPSSFIHSIIDSPEPVCNDKSRRDSGSVQDKSGTVSAGVTTADKLLCENSDSESEEDKIPCSHTFNKPKIQLHRIEHKHTEAPHKASHRKSVRHSKQSSPDVKTKISKHSPTYKKEGRKLSHLDDDADVILRRSPRKHKNSPLTTPTKSSSRRCLSKESPAKVEKHGKLSSSQSEYEKKVEGKDQGRTSKNILNESESCMDETVDFTQQSEGGTLQDNQSMDCYTVMPLKNGQLDAGNQFQVNVTKDKHNKNKNVKNKLNKTSPKSPNMNMNNLDETLKSPSILTSDRKGFSQNSVQGGGSSCDSSQSLSPSVVSSKMNKSRDMTRDVEVIDLDWMSKKGGSQELGSRSQQRSNPRSAQRGKNKIGKSGNLYLFNFEPSDTSTKVNVQNLHQTTLTQGFFSPKHKSEDKGEVSENRKSENSDDKSPGLFKKPLFKADKRSKTKNKEHDITTNVATIDELDVSGPVPGAALTDITLDTAHSMNIDTDLNGSIDPGAELTPWNDEPPSLPSLETDIENIDPEPNDLTMENSFDCRPKKPENKIAHVAVVRKQDERQKLQGHGCKQCLEYYKSTGRSDEEIKNHMCQCSRHRAAYVPPDTPPHFWSIGFIDTQESNNESGKKKAADKDEAWDLPSYRRRKRLNKYFKAKNEMSYQENSEEIMDL